MQKIVVTGASGFLGGRLLKYLTQHKRAIEVIGTGRRSERKAEFEQLHCQYQAGDLLDENFCRALLENADVIVHCAALSAPWGKREEFVKANIRTTQNLLNTGRKSGVKKFVFISTPSIYYDGRHRFHVSENDPLPSKPVNEYAATKWEAEMEVLRQNSPTFQTIALRPRAIIGEEDTVIFPRLLKAYQSGRLKIIGDGRNVVDLTTARNVIEAVICALYAPKEAYGQAYNITNGEPVILWDEINFLLTKLGLTPVSQHVPLGMADAFAKLMELKAKITGGSEPTLTRYGIGVLAKSLTMDISKAKALLTYQPVQTTREGIIEFIEWYRNQQL
ncbi:NAD-dependent epimerase/dehydratase family protein [Runella sp.]|uniref:NAD-dependent epimerase/dehydratase family protein n=1 Tax=Runella sp. TaxID=1960881 RepID=UPI003D143DA0